MSFTRVKYGSASIGVGNAGSAVTVEIDKGALHRVVAAIEDIPKITIAAALVAQRVTAERIKKEIRKCIRENRAPIGTTAWPQLSPKTKKYKTKTGADSARRWYWTGLLYNSLVIKQYGTRLVVTVKTGVTNPKSGGKATLAEIAKYLEYGTDKMPEMPLFRPVHQKFKNNAVIQTLTIYHIKRMIMRKHGVRAKVNF